ncbi:MAG: flagellar filament capping protein FliD [Sedimenticola sp.]
MAIGIPGVGSGMDLSTVIDQMMAVKRGPLDRNLAQQSEIDAEVSAYGSVKSAVSSFKTALSALRFQSAFNPVTAESSTTTVATASTTGGAVASNYALTVTNLATVQKTASTVYTNGTTDVGGTGTLRLTVDGTNYDVAITSENSTLNGIRDAINNTADLDVTASVINEDGGSRLILTSDSTGVVNGFTTAFTSDSVGGLDDNDGLSKLFYMDAEVSTTAVTVTTALDAQITLDGFDITSASNSVTSAISGLTINLVAAGSSTLTISRDNATIKSSIETFIEKYNELQSAITDARAGDLSNDSSLSFIRSGLNHVLNTAATGVGDYSTLTAIGISRDRSGVMSLDSAIFDSILSTNHEDVTGLFSDDTEGFATRLYSYADDLLASDGAIGSREAALADRKIFLQLVKARLEDQLDSYEARIVKQFAQLDSTVLSLDGMSSYLTQQMATFVS